MKVLDLFCGAGGASMGYHQAGFEVVGIDIIPQPHYPFPLIQMDALDIEEEAHDFDLIHASPPCQAYSASNNIHQKDYPRLIEPTRELLIKMGKPYIIENVPRSPLINPIQLCGLSLGVNVKRHRIFESNLPLVGTKCIKYHPGDWLLIFGKDILERRPPSTNGIRNKRKYMGLAAGREAMGIDWMTVKELSDAIPPAYTKYLGEQVIELL